MLATRSSAVPGSETHSMRWRPVINAVYPENDRKGEEAYHPQFGSPRVGNTYYGGGWLERLGNRKQTTRILVLTSHCDPEGEEEKQRVLVAPREANPRPPPGNHSRGVIVNFGLKPLVFSRVFMSDAQAHAPLQTFVDRTSGDNQRIYRNVIPIEPPSPIKQARLNLASHPSQSQGPLPAFEVPDALEDRYNMALDDSGEAPQESHAPPLL
ncbi:hypothetical protein K438DRAFT_1775797 [Mycena galopus ATCC 62051]|nr:hypothetical protein K438DRAFT_1775797 [Mycena galopus ATCC 62051]